MKRLARGVLVQVVVVGGLFLLAGTWKDPWLWAFGLVFAAVCFYALISIDDDLARERFRPPSPGADKVSLRIVRIVALAHLVVGALDIRWQWTSMAAPLRAIGVVGFALSFWMILRAMKANRFFSAVVRVQTERGHQVVDRGPYGVVRHPGYAAMILAVPFSGLALGSWLAVAVALVYSGLILRRVIFEDRYLHENLAGYRDYAARVRYRLVPGAW
jgi:protein-S-isoprenylcysteine O-methyltransferase Ste14